MPFQRNEIAQLLHNVYITCTLSLIKTCYQTTSYYLFKTVSNIMRTGIAAFNNYPFDASWNENVQSINNQLSCFFSWHVIRVWYWRISLLTFHFLTGMCFFLLFLFNFHFCYHFNNLILLVWAPLSYTFTFLSMSLSLISTLNNSIICWIELKQ